MVQTPLKSLTLDDFLALPETKPASEYINGEILQKPMPKGKHSRLQGKLIITLDDLENHHLAIALPELRCTFGGRSIVPDIAVLRWENIPHDESGEIADTILTAPDWTIEILSPGQNQSKVISNILHCLDHGTTLGWLLDPAEKSVIAYPNDARSRYIHQPEATLPIPPWAAPLKITLGQIFQSLQT